MPPEKTLHKPVWAGAGEPPPGYPPLDTDLEVDVAVVGAGFTGLTAALLLKEAGMRVAVLEKDRVAWGDSGASTAHLTAMLDAGMDRILRGFGEDQARAVVQANADAIRFIEERAAASGEGADFARVPAWLYTEEREGERTLDRNAQAAHRLGLEARRVEEVPLPFRVHGALRIEDQARVDPMAYLRGLARRVEGDGSRVYEGTMVRDVENAHTLVTEQGAVRARDVVLATHIPVGLRVQVVGKVEPHRTYVVGARTAQPLEGLFWDTADPYHYTRTHPLPDGHALIVGGEDHHVGQEREPSDAYRRLEAYVGERFAGAQPTHRWSGQVMESADGLPYVGRYPGARHTWVATGYGGNGTTHGTMAAHVLAALLQGRGHPLARVLEPGRMRAADAVGIARQTLGFAGELVAGRMAPAEDLASVPPGQGAVVARGRERYAVFRDERGQVTSLDPVCTHARCLVKFNDAERTWDCPCHGSRFDTQGRVLEGPATRDLPPKPLAEEEEAQAPGRRA